MTIDEAIEYELNGGVVPPTKDIFSYRKQISEWLEELKELRKNANEWRKAGYKHGFSDGYKKAVDEQDSEYERKSRYPWI